MPAPGHIRGCKCYLCDPPEQRSPGAWGRARMAKRPNWYGDPPPGKGFRPRGLGPDMTPCPTCRGTGKTWDKKGKEVKCPACNGVGRFFPAARVSPEAVGYHPPGCRCGDCERLKRMWVTPDRLSECFGCGGTGKKPKPDGGVADCEGLRGLLRNRKDGQTASPHAGQAAPS